MTIQSTVLAALLLLPVAVQPVHAQEPVVVTSSLQSPMRMILTPGGNLLVTETSLMPHSGRVSMVDRSGNVRPLLTGLPSGAEVTGGPGGPTAMALDGRTLYVAIGGGEEERPGPRPGTSVPNPTGISSPLFSSVLRFEMGADVDTLQGPYAMTPANGQTLADGFPVRLESPVGPPVTADVLVDFRSFSPDPVAIYRFSNPFGLAVLGGTLYVADASYNTLVRVDTTTGRSQVITRFAPLPNATRVGPPVVDAVPDSVRVYGGVLLVSLLTGFPFTPGQSRVVAVNPETRAAEPFINTLNSAVDILPTTGPAGAPRFFVAEFSTNQSATPPGPGRVLLYDNPIGRVLAGGLRAPVSLAYDPSTRDLFVLELTGRVLRVPVP